MSVKDENLVEDIDNVEQIQEEELVDETQVESDEETLEEKAKVKEEEEEEDEDEVEDESDEDEVEVEEVQIPKTKAGIVNAAYEMLKKAKKDEAVKLYQGMMKAGLSEEVTIEEGLTNKIEKEIVATNTEIDLINGDIQSVEDAFRDNDIDKAEMKALNKQHNKRLSKAEKKLDQLHAKLKKAQKNESFDYAEEADVSHIDYEEDLNVLVAEEATLSEGFRDKASVIFEAALKTKVGGEIDRLEGEYAQNLEEEVAAVKTDLVEKVDAYLNYVVEGWMQENEVAVEAGLRTEIAEDFMTSLQSVFKEHYISVPEGKEDLVDELSEQVAELEEQLNKTTDENVELFQSVQEAQRTDVVRKHTSDLAATEAEKLASLVEDVEFGDVESFDMKVKTIKESYFVKESAESTSEVEEIVGTDQGLTEEVSGSMARYTSALSSHVFTK